MLRNIIFLVLIFDQSNTKILETKTIINETVRIDYYLRTILQRFKEFDLIFHNYEYKYDINFLQELQNTEYWPISIHSYSRSSKFFRPEVFQAVHVIYSLNIEIINILAEPTRIKSKDVLIFVSRENISDKITTFGQIFPKISGKVLLLQENFKNDIEIYKLCYYCGGESMKLILLQSNNIADTDLFPSKFTNLNGHLLKICMMQYFPYLTCDQNLTRNEIIPREELTNVECVKISGIEEKLLKLVSKSINFTYKIFLMHPDAGWFNMIELVNKNEMDFAIGGISPTAERIPKVQFSIYFNYESYNLMYLFGLSFWEIFNNFMSPFKATLVWSLYLISFILVSWIMYVTWKVEIGIKRRNVTFMSSLWVSKKLMR